MFHKECFTPVHIQGTGAKSPRIFAYYSEDDLLSEIMKPGYFSGQVKILTLPNSFIKVVCKDAIAEIVVENNRPEVTIRPEITRAVDPYKEMIKPRARRTAVQIKAAKEKAKLAKTG